MVRVLLGIGSSVGVKSNNMPNISVSTPDKVSAYTKRNPRIRFAYAQHMPCMTRSRSVPPLTSTRFLSLLRATKATGRLQGYYYASTGGLGEWVIATKM